ncbi:GDSL ESTERASE/LIPASE [Salix koriyanagi]|uniref:GDSL ESTERASE/LIPASE n=1 Tax=Salix koriyanagi TaxID=2511006 RepID=A0A9Q0YUA6_9ROSI|nr:GDSL ESTERASE/LIPASE [Salix koriyanagi]
MAIGGEFDRHDGGSSEAYGYCRVQMPQCMKELCALGGRTFLVVNVAPIGYYLAFLFELPHKSSDVDAFGCLISYNKAVMDCNNMLKTAPSQTRMAFPKASLGSNVARKACCGHGGGKHSFDPKAYCGNTRVVNGSSETALACDDPFNYVSQDGMHFTEAANKLITVAILDGSYFDPPFPLHRPPTC